MPRSRPQGSAQSAARDPAQHLPGLPHGAPMDPGGLNDDSHAASGGVHPLSRGRGAVAEHLPHPKHGVGVRRLSPQLSRLDAGELPSYARPECMLRLPWRRETRHTGTPNPTRPGGLRLLPHRRRLGHYGPGGAPHPAACVLHHVPRKRPATGDPLPHPVRRDRVRRLSHELSGLDTNRLPTRACSEHLRCLP